MEETPIEIRKKKEDEKFFSNIPFNWIVALLMVIIFALYMWSKGAFSGIPTTTLYIILGVGGVVIYILREKIRGSSTIGMEAAEDIALAHMVRKQVKGHILPGSLVLRPMQKLRKIKGKPTDYYNVIDLETDDGNTITYMVGVNNKTGDVTLVDPVIGGVTSIKKEVRDLIPMPEVTRKGVEPSTIFSEQLEED